MELTLERIEALSQRYDAAGALAGVVDGPFLTGERSCEYVVPSSGRGKWVITGHPGPLACSCPDYRTRQHLHGGHCKHVLAVMLVTRAVAEVSGKVAQEYAKDPELERKIAELF